MARDPHDAVDHAGPVPLSVPGWCARFIGVPYREDGHGFDGANCAGLVHLVLKHRAGVEIDPHADVSAADIERASTLLEMAAISDLWLPVAGKPRPLDVALLRGTPLHTGIIVAEDLLLHVWRAPASMVMNVNNPRIRHRIMSFYRHKALA